jgi:hypothetical protein
MTEYHQKSLNKFVGLGPDPPRQRKVDCACCREKATTAHTERTALFRRQINTTMAPAKKVHGSDSEEEQGKLSGAPDALWTRSAQ